MLNSISMVGRLTRDPELRNANNGTSVGSFHIACDGLPGPNGEKQVVFIPCTIFGKGADTLVKFFAKGNLIGVVGRLTQRKYVNKNNVEVTSTEIVADRIEFVDSKSDRETQASTQVPSSAPASQPNNGVVAANNTQDIDISDESLPF